MIDREGDQCGELLAFDDNGREALAALGLQGSAGADFIGHLLSDGSRESLHVASGLGKRRVDCRHLPPAARLWPAGTPAGFSRAFTSSAAVLVVVAAPGARWPWTRSNAPANCA
uniref:Uncharacterized protein n=1 Tax=Ectopseudomonas oleovorans TaxID=301 RepID=A0A653AXL7_ECTOL